MKLYSVLALIFGALLLVACNSSPTPDKSGCLPPKDGFAEANLYGTWSHESLGDTDTLVFREGNTYKQILHVKSRQFDYESDWQSWRIEYADNGIPYIHLEGMRLCAYFREMGCDQAGGGEGNWYDFCQEKLITMPGEGVLMALSVPEQFKQPLRGINLKLPTKYTEGVWWYEFQSESTSTK